MTNKFHRKKRFKKLQDPTHVCGWKPNGSQNQEEWEKINPFIAHKKTCFHKLYNFTVADEWEKKLKV